MSPETGDWRKGRLETGGKASRLCVLLCNGLVFVVWEPVE